MSNLFKYTKTVDCDCHGHLMRFDLLVWNRGDIEVNVSLWEPGHHSNNRLSFWNRLKYAWWELKGNLTTDDLIIHQKDTLIELREIIDELITEWDKNQGMTNETTRI